MKVKIFPSIARGRVSAPPSKSMSHRYLICAALAHGESRIRGISDCDDVRATADCFEALGATVKKEENDIRINGADIFAAAPSRELFCRESGSTLRFLAPLCLLSGNKMALTGAPSLLSRPMDIYAALSREKGFEFEQKNGKIELCGTIKSGEYRLDGGVSSQFVSGLLFALPMLAGDSKIILTPPVASRPYIDMTLAAQRKFGVLCEWENENTLKIRGGQSYRAAEVTVEGDYSGAAFFAALSSLGGEVELCGLLPDTLQGDRVYEEYFPLLERGAPTLDMTHCPDLAPVLFALAAAKNGGKFLGTARLKIKESDRAEAMAAELRKFGSEIKVNEDSVEISKCELHAPTEELCGHNDHRIVMALAVLCTKTGGVINGAEAVKKSLPDFFEKISKIGIETQNEA